jgi:periplasmic copper chaperone A
MTTLLIKQSAAVTLAMLLSLHSAVSASDNKSKTIEIEKPYATSTAPGQPHGAVFIHEISNKGSKADELIGGRSAVAGSVEVHKMEMSNNTMRMREIPAIAIPANGKTSLDKGSKDGFHLMLMNLKQPLKAGEKIPMTLIFKQAGEINITVPVEKPSSRGHHGEHGHGSHKH